MRKQRVIVVTCNMCVAWCCSKRSMAMEDIDRDLRLPPAKKKYI